MKVVVTGAAGRIGRTVVPGLIDIGHDVRGIDRVAPEVAWADRVVVADLATDADPLAEIALGAEGIVHLAANAGETDFDTAVGSHLGLTHRVLEQAVQSGVRRVVYASSNHAVGFTPHRGTVPAAPRVRPDTFYGVGKAAAEALCSLYHDRHGLQIACLRIGSFRERPTNRRELATWLSPGDAVRLVEACLGAPDLTFATVFGISANTRAWWDTEPARALGYQPLDDAERWAAEIESTPPTPDDELDDRYVGGEFIRRW